MKRLESVVGKVADVREAVDRRTRAWCAAVRSRLADTRGQGTTESVSYTHLGTAKRSSRFLPMFDRDPLS